MENHKKQGLVTEWHPDGKVKSKKNYKNGKLHGVCAEWDEMGRKATEANYKDDEKHGLSTYWVEGFTIEGVYKSREINYKADKRHGLHSQWYENGQKEYEINFKDRARHGISTWWHENGQKESVEYFVLAKSYACIFWSKQGNVTKTEIPTKPKPVAPVKPSHKNQKPKTKYGKP